MVFLYLLAIVAANLITNRFGPSASIANSFLFIGLDLTSRDKLHEAWKGRGLVWKMGILILAGSVLSWAFNRDAGRIAIASFLAFLASATIDAIVYHLLRRRTRMVKVTGSNLFSAAADSIIFPWYAFHGFMPWVTLLQFIAKVTGGYIWMVIIQRLSSSDSILCETHGIDEIDPSEERTIPR